MADNNSDLVVQRGLNYYLLIETADGVRPMGMTVWASGVVQDKGSSIVVIIRN
ncbi:hypothetical protein DSUL_20415 [Desulfovibrionales bacterium]